MAFLATTFLTLLGLTFLAMAFFRRGIERFSGEVARNPIAA